MSEDVRFNVMVVRLGRGKGKDIHDFLKSHTEDELRALLDNPIASDRLEAEIIDEKIIALKDRFSDITPRALCETLGQTIKHDDIPKVITFLCGLSAFTEEGQFNLGFFGPSSSGKTYIVLQVIAYFPQEDVMILAYSSPKAFYHDHEGERLEDGTYVVDLERMIIVFLDQSRPELIESLRPLLSHDRKTISLKIVDKEKSLRTKKILLIGYPAVLFCTANFKVDEQEATRFIMLSPETSQDKIRDAIWEKIRKEGDIRAYAAEIERHPERRLLKERILAIREANIGQIRIKDVEQIRQRFLEGKGHLRPRHARDIARVINLIKTMALLNFWHREIDGRDVYVNDRDIDHGFELWAAIAESQELNLPEYVFRLYKDIVEPLLQESPKGITRLDIIREHMMKYQQPLEDWRLRRDILPMLEMAGLTTQSDDPNDRRRKLIHSPLVNPERIMEDVFNQVAAGIGLPKDEVKGGASV